MVSKFIINCWYVKTCSTDFTTISVMVENYTKTFRANLVISEFPKESWATQLTIVVGSGPRENWAAILVPRKAFSGFSKLYNHIYAYVRCIGRTILTTVFKFCKNVPFCNGLDKFVGYDVKCCTTTFLQCLGQTFWSKESPTKLCTPFLWIIHKANLW